MKLERPLAFFDLETTGLDVTNDRIIEIGIVKLNPDGTREVYEQRINPTIPISEESKEITGISDEDVKDCPTFADLADQIAAFFGDADLAGYNSNKFDIPVLAEEFLRAESNFDMSERQFIDVQNIFHKMEQRTLAAAYQFYCGKELIDAHAALADVEATKEVLFAQLNRYTDLKPEVGFLSEFSRSGSNEILDFAGRIAKNDKGEVIYNFGKHKGKTIAQVDQEESGYYGWMMNANFPLYTKNVLKREMERIKASRENTGSSLEEKMNALKNKFKQE
jgi:DNA polymerase-3 subunit epsilon